MKSYSRQLLNSLFLLVLLLILNINICSSTENDTLLTFMKEISIPKCRCKNNEYFFNGTCQKGDTKIDIILSLDYIEPFHESTSVFGVANISYPQCFSESTLVSVEPTDLYILALTGELFHLSTGHFFSSVEYCLEHTLNESGSIVWEVNICLQSPTIQVCCEDNSCVLPQIPIYYGYSSLKEPNINYFHSNLKCEKDEVKDTVAIENPISSSHISYENSTSLLVLLKESEVKYLSPDKYCIVSKSKQEGMHNRASYCIPDPVMLHKKNCEGFSCVKKCCPEGRLYSTSEHNCIPYDEKMLWQPNFLTKNGNKREPPSDLKLIHGLPNCQRGFYHLDPQSSNDKFRLLEDGRLRINSDSTIESWRYCLENFLSSTNAVEEAALVCFPDSDPIPSTCSKVQKYLYPILLLLSCAFLAITLTVYAMIPELHAKLHGKSLLSHVTALLVAYLSLAIIRWISSMLSMAACKSFGFIVQISFLAAFFWLNVMCFDIWWALRSMRPAAETRSTCRRRFFYYSLYAWGCPLIIGLITITMEILTQSKDYKHLISPGFGRSKCFFDENIALWVYFYSFVTILTVANVIFFILVAIILLQAQRANSDILRFNRQHHKERIWIYLKLFVVMGINWICEMISFEEGSCEYWLFTDIINALQGFFIFLIFICKRNVCVKLKAKWHIQKKRRKPGSATSDGSSSRSTLQSTLESSTRKLSSLQHHLSKLQKETIKEDLKEKEADTNG